jgi:transposase
MCDDDTVDAARVAQRPVADPQPQQVPGREQQREARFKLVQRHRVAQMQRLDAVDHEQEDARQDGDDQQHVEQLAARGVGPEHDLAAAQPL